MRILALDSSTGFASVALTENRTLLHLTQDRSGHAHSETLLPTVVSALDKHRLTPRDIDLFSCVVGPGSYTGVRIGVATVKGLAWGSGKPCVPVSSLEALAENCPCDGLICPVIDARRGQMYTALFEKKNGVLHRIFEDELLPLFEIGKRLKRMNRKTLLTGDGCKTCEELLNNEKWRAAPELLCNANAYGAAVCALRIFSENAEQPLTLRKTFHEADLLPVYLRETQAERERAERLGKLER